MFSSVWRRVSMCSRRRSPPRARRSTVRSGQRRASISVAPSIELEVRASSEETRSGARAEEHAPSCWRRALHERVQRTARRLRAVMRRAIVARAEDGVFVEIKEDDEAAGCSGERVNVFRRAVLGGVPGAALRDAVRRIVDVDGRRCSRTAFVADLGLTRRTAAAELEIWRGGWRAARRGRGRVACAPRPEPMQAGEPDAAASRRARVCA